MNPEKMREALELMVSNFIGLCNESDKAKVLAALSTPAPSDERGWQDIASAPKDGTILWGWMTIGVGRRPFMDTMAWFQTHGDGTGWWVSHCRPVEPILWQPLPLLPSTKDTSDVG